MQTQEQTAGGLSLIDEIMRFEGEQMTREELIPFFQRLVDTGMAWRLQGTYGRTAHALLSQGLIRPRANA